MANTAGTLVGSILESAGYIYQAHILDKLGNPLTDLVGGLVYLLGISIVIFQVAILKQSKGAAWLLIGPPLFLACITARSDIGYARWSFGTHERNQGKVNEGVSSFTDTANGSASTSTVFKRYVEMIAPVVAKVTDKVTGSQDKNDMWFLFKGEIFSMLGVRKIENPGLQYLIQYGLMGECHKVFDAARVLTDPLKKLESGDVATEVEVEKAKEKFSNLVQKTKITIRPMMAKDFIAKLEGEDAGITSTGEEPVIYSCIDIWRMILKGLLSEAGVVEGEIEKESEQRDLNPDVIKAMIGMADGLNGGGKLHSSDNAGGFIDVNKLIAGYLLRNEIRSPNMGALVGKFINRTEIRSIETRLMGGENAATEYARIGLDEWSEKERLVHAALSMPYYQGLALYFLGIAYPFFALLLLIPGKAMGFLNWFMLWLWVKSWDIGFAIVMKIDTLFWGIFVETKAQLSKVHSADYIMSQDDMFFAIAALDRMDPSFQAGTYYTMIAVCLMSVPVISAQLVLGASNAGASLVSEGVSRYSDYFASSARGFMAQDVINSLKSEAKSLQEQAGLARATSHLFSSLESSGGASGGGVSGGIPLQGGGSTLSGYESRMTARGSVSSSASDVISSTNRLKMSEAVGPLDRTPTPGANASKLQDQANLMAQRSAWSQGFKNPFHFHDGNASTAMQRIAGMVTLGERVYQKAFSESELKNLQADLKAEGIDAAWYSSVEDRAYELHRNIARFGGIPIPWTAANEEGSSEEFQRHVMRFDQKISLLNATLNMANEASSTSLDFARDPGWTSFFFDNPATNSIGAFYNSAIDKRDRLAGIATIGATALSAATTYGWDNLSPSVQSHFSNVVDPDGSMEEEEKKGIINRFMSGLPVDLRNLIVEGADDYHFNTDPFGLRREFREIDRQKKNHFTK